MSEHDPNFHNDLMRNLETSFCDFESKQSTREETYDDILKVRAQLRRENKKLQQKLSITKEKILQSALGIYLQELEELNKENQNLRREYSEICIKKKPLNICNSQEKNKTPRSRKSFANGCQPCLKSKMTENDDFSARKSLKNKQNEISLIRHGCESLKSPKIRRSQVSQLTQKKNSRNSKHDSISQLYSDYGSRRNSLHHPNSSYQKGNGKKSLFLDLVNIVCQEQKIQENNIATMVEKEEEEVNYYKEWKEEKININELEQQAQESQKNIQKLTSTIQLYEKQILDMNIQTNSVTNMTKELFLIKEQLLRMQAKCQKINQFKRQLSLKEPKLQDLKEKLGPSHDKFIIKPPRSIKMMLRVYGIEEKKMKDPSKCKSELKKLVRGKLDKPTVKKVKIKQLLQTARQGRKKFKELISVYNTRISKIENKISHLKVKKNIKLSDP